MKLIDECIIEFFIDGQIKSELDLYGTCSKEKFDQLVNAYTFRDFLTEKNMSPIDIPDLILSFDNYIKDFKKL